MYFFAPFARFSRQTAVAALVFFSLFFSERLGATTVAPPDFPALVNQSDFIVRAVVTSIRSELEQTAGGRKIFTFVELSVSEVIAGEVPRPLVLRILGGKVGAEKMVLEGAPEFRVGDEDILFVQGNGQQIFPLVALMHGRYPIQAEKETGKKIVTRSNKAPLRDLTEVALPMSDQGTVAVQATSLASGPALTPEEFVQQIKAAIKPSNSRLHER